jgi:predicted acyltransferase
MQHVRWEGFSAWDLIMPLFLFTVGVVMPFSFAKRIERGQSKWAMHGKLLERSLILFVLGMIAQCRLLEFDLSQLYIIYNTLQAIAMGYLVAGLLMLNVSLVGQVAAAAGLLVGYWLLMMLVPFPGYEAGVFEPNVNLAAYIDEVIMGRYRSSYPYTWVLSGMRFSASVLLGVFAGYILRMSKPAWVRLLALVGMGGACLALGRIWSYCFPIIKHLWTSSIVLWATGWSCLLLALFYLIIDMLGFRKWAFPLVVIGVNAIAVYMATRLFDFRLIGDVFVHGLVRHISTPAGELVRASAALAVVWLILLYMYRKRTFVRV